MDELELFRKKKLKAAMASKEQKGKDEDSWFSHVTMAKLNTPIQSLYEKDTHPMKVNLTNIAYVESEGTVWILPVVERAKNVVVNDDTLYKEEMPVFGLPSFCFGAVNLLVGYECPALIESRCFGIQTLSTTGGLRLAAEYLKIFMNHTTVYVTLSCSQFLSRVFKRAGFDKIMTYRYWNNNIRMFDVNALIQDLMGITEKTVFVFSNCGIDGCNPTKEDWIRIAEVVKTKNIFPIFDCGCLGFDTGDFDKDLWSVRYFIKRGFELFCVQDYERVFALYDCSIGCLTVVKNNYTKLIPTKLKFRLLIEGMYHGPTKYGANIISYILNNHDLRLEWIYYFKLLVKHIQTMRIALRSTIEFLEAPGDWSFLTEQQGFYTYTSFTRKQCEYLRKNHHIYMMNSGRICMTAISYSNLEHIANAIYDTVRTIPE